MNLTPSAYAHFHDMLERRTHDSIFLVLITGYLDALPTLLTCLVYLKLGKLFGDLFASFSNVDFLFDVRDLAVFADVDRHSIRPFASQDSVRLSGLLVGVAEQWKIEFQFFGELFVLFDRIATCTEECYVELRDFFATLTE